MATPLMVITGPVGVGKTTVANAASALLERAGMPHAMIDLDQLRQCYPAPAADRFHVALGLRNLAAVWKNYRVAGAERLILADVVESRADLAGYRRAVPDAAILVVRLSCPLPTIERRIEEREAGNSLDWHRRRAAELSALMDRNRVEDLLVDTEGKTPSAVAGEALVLGGWLEASAARELSPAFA